MSRARRLLYMAEPAWEEPAEVRAMLQNDDDSEPLYEDKVPSGLLTLHPSLNLRCGASQRGWLTRPHQIVRSGRLAALWGQVVGMARSLRSARQLFPTACGTAGHDGDGADNDYGGQRDHDRQYEARGRP